MRHLIMALLLLGVGLFLAPFAQAGELVPGQEAEPRIQQLIQQLEERRSAMDALYGYKAAPQTLAQAFSKGNVGWAQRYSGSWGGWLYLDWTKVRDGFYNPHIGYLKTSLHELRMKGAISASDLDYLERGVSAWLAEEKRISRVFADYTQTMVNEGQILDRIHQAGNDVKAKKQFQGPRNALDNVQKNMKTTLAAYRKKRLFSAITAQERIAVEAPAEAEAQKPENRQECLKIQHRRQDLPPFEPFQPATSATKNGGNI